MQKLSRFLFFGVAIVIAIVNVIFLAGCSSPDNENQQSEPISIENAIKIDLDSSDDESLVAFYFGSFLGPDEDLSEVVVHQNGSWWMKKPTEAHNVSLLTGIYAAAGSDGVLQWEELEGEVQASYYEARNAPPTVDALRSIVGNWTEEDWFSHELNGQMTAFRRKLAVKKSNLWKALDQLADLSSPVIYPVGTAFIGEHLDNGVIMETTVMVKRPDSYWDFFAYGKDGYLTTFIHKEPNNLTVPTQCVGCHFGDRLFEPERSFPADARPGPRGVRSIYVAEEAKNGLIAKQLSEHAKRSDHILGLYATLFLAEINTRVGQGKASTREQEMINKLGISTNSN